MHTVAENGKRNAKQASKRQCSTVLFVRVGAVVRYLSIARTVLQQHINILLEFANANASAKMLSTISIVNQICVSV